MGVRAHRWAVAAVAGVLIVGGCSSSDEAIVMPPPPTIRPVLSNSTSDTFPIAPGSTTTTTVPPTTTTTTVAGSTTTTTIAIVPSDVLFETARWDLGPDAETALTAVARDIKVYAPHAKLFIVGHTDSRGTVEFNQQLSQLRAESVAEWFINWGFAPAAVRFPARR